MLVNGANAMAQFDPLKGTCVGEAGHPGPCLVSLNTTSLNAHADVLDELQFDGGTIIAVQETKFDIGAIADVDKALPGWNFSCGKAVDKIDVLRNARGGTASHIVKTVASGFGGVAIGATKPMMPTTSVDNVTNDLWDGARWYESYIPILLMELVVFTSALCMPNKATTMMISLT